MGGGLLALSTENILTQWVWEEIRFRGTDPIKTRLRIHQRARRVGEHELYLLTEKLIMHCQNSILWRGFM